MINLTHTRGDGALAHEWGHFLDHQLTADPAAFREEKRGRMTVKVAPHLSDGKSEGKDPVVNAAFRQVMAAIRGAGDRSGVLEREVTRAHNERLREISSRKRRENLTQDAYMALWEQEKADFKLRKLGLGNTAFFRDALLLDGSSDAYWASPAELFARAWESRIEDRMRAAGRNNAYPVSGTRVRYDHQVSRKEGDQYATAIVEPYPHGAEREAIGAAIDELIEAIGARRVLCQ